MLKQPNPLFECDPIADIEAIKKCMEEDFIHPKFRKPLLGHRMLVHAQNWLAGNMRTQGKSEKEIAAALERTEEHYNVCEEA